GTEISIEQSSTYDEGSGGAAIALLEEIVEIDGRTLSSRYDVSARTSTVTTPAGREIVKTFDARGRPLTMEPGGLAPLAYMYDGDGRIENVKIGTGASARSVALTYGANGLVQSITDPLGRTQSFTYDAAGRVASRTLAGGRTVSFGYDARGRTVEVTPPGGEPWTFEWTPRGRLAKLIPPAADGDAFEEIAYEYDADGALSRVSLPDGRSVEYFYDAAGRADRIVMSD